MRERAGRLRRLPHGRDRDDRPGRGGVPPAHPLQRRDEDRRRTARSTPCCAARTAACSTTSSPTASATTASSPSPTPSNHEKDLAWLRRHAARLRRQGPRPPARLRDARRPGPRRARDRRRPGRRRAARSASGPPTLTVAGAPGVLVCGTGYTGEDGVELLVAPEHAPAVWDARGRRRRHARGPRRARHAAPGGLLPPLRQRPDARSAARSRPASAGAARRTPASSAPTPCARSARPARPRSSSRSR